ncbi:Short-chain dehydrogenase [Chishuiella changwenlii]|uniref:Short-chain dehydrogenase n=1 Tax=Chishuiella changwenlii TaxID=1434701 RepID=A0A1M7BA43_9FLAO|nr:SDR family oxidoreductase [Chishuiella changwenlii]GGE96283.1 short-chain dehydrogenase [Chishuiella changwenlii]SHL51885.1 Short-chain dehydrogenase [Chishuiella changwenlii]
MKNIIITGASRGIGYELAKQHLALGNRVLTISRNVEKLKELETFAKEGQYQFIGIDLTDFNEIEKVLEAVKSWEIVDVLYNNAGLCINKPFAEIKQEDLLQSWQINFMAPYRLIQVLLPKFKISSHVVNVSTMGAVQGSVKFPGLSVYSSSKSATVNLTELLAEELKENGPRINAVALGAVQTEMLEEAFPGYIAPTQPCEMAEYLVEFGLNGWKYFNGKTQQASISTP